MRSAVVFPEPEGPTSDHELAVLDVQVERVDGGHVGARVDPRRLHEADVSHRSPPSVGETASCLAHARLSRGIGPDLVEREERGADHRRRRRRRDHDLRRDLAQPPRAPRSRRPSMPDQAAAEQHLGRLLLELEPRQRDARERDDLAPRLARRSRPRPRRASASANTIGGSSSSTRARRSRRRGSPRPAPAASASPKCAGTARSRARPRPASVLAARCRGQRGEADVVAASPVAADGRRARRSARGGRRARRRRS